MLKQWEETYSSFFEVISKRFRNLLQHELHPTSNTYSPCAHPHLKISIITSHVGWEVQLLNSLLHLQMITMRDQRRINEHMRFKFRLLRLIRRMIRLWRRIRLRRLRVMGSLCVRL